MRSDKLSNDRITGIKPDGGMERYTLEAREARKEREQIRKELGHQSWFPQ